MNQNGFGNIGTNIRGNGATIPQLHQAEPTSVGGVGNIVNTSVGLDTTEKLLLSFWVFFSLIIFGLLYKLRSEFGKRETSRTSNLTMEYMKG